MAMSTITINFQNATLTTTTSQILITNGTFALDTTSSLSMAGTISFTSLYITSGAINFNVESGTSFTAAVVTPVHQTGSNSPTLEVTNFAGTVTVTWPTPNGLQTQTVMSGDPITLNNFAS
ncbi:hypothetical protein JMG10_29860 [Nostoc ellipsosporum NOK]|uniref:hypothetical protein n=1 Tax=Sphingomonas sp. IBVSS2 TaxID=1985172 RepID=UPI000A2E37D8|nr:hypothetical protein [Sphingomonas sp. IBVSS2]MDF2385709.1 hypothetical protein [Nostoc ellipsosporum NOK]OSZ65049.1 hypothetical protein CAP40_14625 [Sphingomonas sp. IBVSS2]